MKVLAVHPSGLMYTRVFLRLEPLGLETVAAVIREAGHDVQLIDLQVESHRDLDKLMRSWRPDAVCFSGNYLANIPEIVDLSKSIKAQWPHCFVFVGGHSASFTAADVLKHADGAIDCVLKGEGEAKVVELLDAVARRSELSAIPGVVTRNGEGPPPGFAESLDQIRPARDLLRHRRKYFIGVLDPCASIEFARGCPWDCTFCSAWTFYGRSYRSRSPEVVADELASIREPGVFIVDDVAFVHADHGMAIGRRDRTPRHPQEVLPRDARRRAVAQQGSLRVLAHAGPAIHVHRHGGDRCGRAQGVSQAHQSRQELRGAGVRAFARHHGRRQSDRRSRLGPRPFRSDPAVVPGDSPRSSTSA